MEFGPGVFSNQSLLNNLDSVPTDRTKISILDTEHPMVVQAHMGGPLLLWGCVILLVTLNMDRVGSWMGTGVQCLISRVRGDDGRMLDSRVSFCDQWNGWRVYLCSKCSISFTWMLENRSASNSTGANNIDETYLCLLSLPMWSRKRHLLFFITEILFVVKYTFRFWGWQSRGLWAWSPAISWLYTNHLNAIIIVEEAGRISGNLNKDIVDRIQSDNDSGKMTIPHHPGDSKHPAQSYLQHQDPLLHLGCSHLNFPQLFCWIRHLGLRGLGNLTHWVLLISGAASWPCCLCSISWDSWCLRWGREMRKGKRGRDEWQDEKKRQGTYARHDQHWCGCLWDY